MINQSQFIKTSNFQINKKFYKIFQYKNLLDFEILWNLPDPFFYRKKKYRIVCAYQINEFEIFIKKYLAHPEEAQKEWENIFLLWEKGFSTSIPIFLALSKDKRAMIGTEKIKGDPIINIFKQNPFKTSFFISKIAKFLRKFHSNSLFHQDCYLNHFYYNKNLDEIIIIDVSRVKYKPFFSKYYLIKDLAQLKFSFYTYLNENAEKWWEYFWQIYHKSNIPSPVLKIPLNLKVWFIKRHTQRVLNRGGKL